jgi:hypothetical protein
MTANDEEQQTMISATGNGYSEQTPEYADRKSTFKLQTIWYSFFFVIAVVFEEFGNNIFGLQLSKNFTTYVVFLLLCAMILFGPIGIPRVLKFLFIYILLQTFLYNHSIAGQGQMVGFIGIVIFSLTLFSYVFLFRERLTAVVRIYYGVAVCASVFAILQTIIFVLTGKAVFFLSIFGGISRPIIRGDIFGILPRATGFSGEPAHMATFLYPALYLALVVLLKRNTISFLKSRIAAVVVVLGMMSTFSLSAFVGLAVILPYIYLQNKKKNWRTIFALLLACSFVLVLAYNVPVFNKRINDIYERIQDPEKEWRATDLSTFATVSNCYVTWKSLTDNNYLGTGLKTHGLYFDKYLYTGYMPSQVLMELNTEDASSLYLRLLSEMGIPGILLMGLFLVKYRIHGAGSLNIVNTAALFYIVLFSIRNGDYMSLMLWFFIALYYWSFLYQEKSKHISAH